MIDMSKVTDACDVLIEAVNKRSAASKEKTEAIISFGWYMEHWNEIEAAKQSLCWVNANN